MLCKHHSCHNRDERSPLITRLLAMDQIARKRGQEDTEDESSAVKNRPPLAEPHSAFRVNKEVAK